MADATTVEVEAEEAEAETKTRSQMDKHQGFVDWYEEYAEADLEGQPAAVVIAEFARLRNEFRRSEFYQSQWGEEAREQARAARDAAREEAAEKRAAEREAKAAERAKAKAEKDAAAKANGDSETKAKPKRRVAKKAAASTIEVDETEGGEDTDEDEVFE